MAVAQPPSATGRHRLSLPVYQVDQAQISLQKAPHCWPRCRSRRSKGLWRRRAAPLPPQLQPCPQQQRQQPPRLRRRQPRPQRPPPPIRRLRRRRRATPRPRWHRGPTPPRPAPTHHQPLATRRLPTTRPPPPPQCHRVRPVCGAGDKTQRRPLLGRATLQHCVPAPAPAALAHLFLQKGPAPAERCLTPPTRPPTHALPHRHSPAAAAPPPQKSGPSTGAVLATAAVVTAPRRIFRRQMRRWAACPFVRRLVWGVGRGR